MTPRSAAFSDDAFYPLQAPIIVWDFAAGAALPPGVDPATAVLHKLVFHKGAVQALSFSHDSAFLASLGAQEDNALCVWETASGRSVSGTSAGSHAALTVTWFGGRSDRLVTAGQFHVRTWELNLERRRLFPDDWKTGSVKRIYTCVALDEADSRAFCGTTSGAFDSWARACESPHVGVSAAATIAWTHVPLCLRNKHRLAC